MNTLLNLTGQLDDRTIETLSDVNDVAADLDIRYVVVGATARDLILHHGYGAAIQRATSDIDFAIQVDSWATFARLKQALCNRSFTETTQPHRLANSSGRPIDIVPFGSLLETDATIAWPPDGDVVMSVLGFQEASDHAQPVIIRDVPQLVCPVVSPEGLTILKFIAWQDRPVPTRRKDAADIGYLFSVFRKLEWFVEKLYEENNAVELERYGWDTDVASCHLLGKNCRKIASDQTAAALLAIQHAKDDRNLTMLAAELTFGNVATNLRYLEAFMEGVQTLVSR